MHEGVSAEGVVVQGAVVACGVREEFFDVVAACGLQAAQGDAGVLVCVGALGGVGEEECLLSIGVEEGGIRAVVGGDEAVEVSELGEGAEAVCEGDAGAVFFLFLRGEGAGVEFQAEAACKGNVEAEFSGGVAACIEVGAGGDVAADGVCGEEVGGGPLHAEAVVWVCVIAEPEFFVEGGGGGIDAAAAGGAALEGDVGVLPAELAELVVIGLDVVEVEVALVFCGASGGGGVCYFAVAVPFDVGDAGVLPQEVVNGCGNGGGGGIQYELVAFLAGVYAGEAEGGLRVLCVEDAGGGDHFRFYPEAEVDAAVAGVFDEGGEAVGEFMGCGGPIAKGGGIVVSVGKPAVVQYEEFCAELCGGGDDVFEGGFVHLEVDAFPAVEEGAASFFTARDDAAAEVPVEAAAGMAAALCAEGEDGGGEFEAAAGEE